MTQAVHEKAGGPRRRDRVLRYSAEHPAPIDRRLRGPRQPGDN